MPRSREPRIEYAAVIWWGTFREDDPRAIAESHRRAALEHEDWKRAQIDEAKARA